VVEVQIVVVVTMAGAEAEETGVGEVGLKAASVVVAAVEMHHRSLKFGFGQWQQHHQDVEYDEGKEYEEASLSETS
jgi:hypothetical protein